MYDEQVGEEAVVAEAEDTAGEPWLPLRTYRTGLTKRELRERERDRQIHEHVRRRAEHAGRRRDQGLTREEIVAAAISVADAEGVDAVTMRRIARELRAGAMSLYWHVASKEELQDLMLEAIEAEIEVPEPTGDWRADLRAFARGTRAVWLRHRWVMEFKGFRPPSGPNDARNADRLFGALDGLGLDTGTTIRMLMAVATYVLGAVLREIQEMQTEREMAAIAEALSAEELAGLQKEFAERIRASGRYPRLARLVEEDIDPDDPATREERFEFGLDIVLDGIAARLPPRPTRDVL
jgi:AcrR family transcriptional regulator